MKQNTNNTAQAMWIGIGSFSMFLFGILSSAILSRYLTKDAYGTYKQVMYVYTTLLSVFTLGLPLAYSYFLPRVSLGEGKTLTTKLNGVFLAIGAVFSLILFCGADIFANILNNPNLGNNIRIFSPAPILILPTMGLQGILATYRKTIWNAVYVITTRILMLLFVAFPVVFYSADCETAVCGFIIASFISLFIALYIKNLPFRGVEKKACNITYKDIFQYSVPLMVAGIFGIAIKAADQFYISRYYGQGVFADFANGSQELPFVSMVLSASGTILLPTFSRMISHEEDIQNIVNLWKRTAVKSALILYPLVVFFWFFASETMTFLYGDKYINSAAFFRIMLFINLFTVIPFYPIILALGKTKDYAKINFMIFIAIWTLEYISVKTIHSPYAITAISAICHVTNIFLMLNVVAKTIHIPMMRMLPLHYLFKVIVSCIIAGWGAWFLVRQIPFSHIELFSLTTGFIIFVGLTLLISKPLKIDYIEVIRPIMSKYVRRR